MSYTKPDCYKCGFSTNALGSGHHRQCNNRRAKVTGKAHGVANGWFFWPFDFDPVWLVSCDGFKEREVPHDPVVRDSPDSSRADNS